MERERGERGLDKFSSFLKILFSSLVSRRFSPVSGISESSISDTEILRAPYAASGLGVLVRQLAKHNGINIPLGYINPVIPGICRPPAVVGFVTGTARISPPLSLSLCMYVCVSCLRVRVSRSERAIGSVSVPLSRSQTSPRKLFRQH